MRTLADIGIRYLVADINATPARLPFFAEIAPGQPAPYPTIARTQPDDYYYQQQHENAEALQQHVIEDAAGAARMGALGLLSVHTFTFTEDAPLRQALPALLAYLHRPEAATWLAGGGEIARWWVERTRVQVSPIPHGVKLMVQLGRPLKGISLLVTEDLSRRSTTVRGGSDLPHVTVLPWRGDPRISELRLSLLPSGETTILWNTH